MASITKKGEKYYIVYYVKENGKNKQKWSKGFTSKKDAEKAKITLEYELQHSIYHSVSDSLLSDFLTDWFESYCIPNLSRNTRNGYLNNIDKHIIPYIGALPVKKVTPEVVEDLYKKLRQKGLSETSIVYVHNTLSGAFDYAVFNRTLPYNMMRYVNKPKKKKHHSSVLTVNETEKLLQSCKNTDVYLPVLLAVLMGLRRGEVLGLSWSDIDLDNRTITINHTATYYKSEFVLSDPKTSSSIRTLKVPEKIYSILICYSEIPIDIDINPNRLVCCRSDGRPITSGMLNKIFKQILKDAELPNVRFHDLRHTYATILLKKHIPAKIVSNMLGHSSIGITMDTYSHVMTEMQDSAIDAVDTLFPL